MKREPSSFLNIISIDAQYGKAAMLILVQNPFFRKIAIKQKGGDLARTIDARSYLCLEIGRRDCRRGTKKERFRL